MIVRSSVVPSVFSWSRARRTLLAVSLVLPLAACERTSSITAPEFDAPVAKKNAVCVQTDNSGAIIAVQPYDGTGNCGDGFDLQIWH